MTLDLGRVLDEVADRIITHAEELTVLDSAIGDADHGLNMKRGFEAVLADRAAILAKPLPEALKAVGMTLVMKVGGASGPLYGTLFMTLGKELPAEPTLADAARALAAAVEAVKARGKADFGNKT
ncbi:MAG: DAK2 domain-containing protein, partial [Parvibaculaceae bacterium]